MDEGAILMEKTKTSLAVCSLFIKENGYIFKRKNFVKIVLSSFCKGVYSERKEFAPVGANSFLLE